MADVIADIGQNTVVGVGGNVGRVYRNNVGQAAREHFGGDRRGERARVALKLQTDLDIPPVLRFEMLFVKGIGKGGIHHALVLRFRLVQPHADDLDLVGIPFVSLGAPCKRKHRRAQHGCQQKQHCPLHHFHSATPYLIFFRETFPTERAMRRRLRSIDGTRQRLSFVESFPITRSVYHSYGNLSIPFHKFFNFFTFRRARNRARRKKALLFFYFACIKMCVYVFMLFYSRTSFSAAAQRIPCLFSGGAAYPPPAKRRALRCGRAPPRGGCAPAAALPRTLPWRARPAARWRTSGTAPTRPTRRQNR